MTGYVLTETAEDGLRGILHFIAEKDGKRRAVHVLERFVEAFERLAASPGIGYRREHLTGPDLRWLPVFRFLVLYDAEATPVTIMRVLHGARDLERLFGKD